MLKNLFHSRFIFLIVGLIASIGFGYVDYFQKFFLTAEIGRGCFLSPLAIVFLIFIVDSALLTAIGYEGKAMNRDKTKKLSDKASGILLYFLLFAGGVLTMYLIRVLYVFIGFDFKVNALFEIGFREIIWFLVFLNIFIAYFIFSLYVYMKLDRLGLTLKEKFYLVFVNLLLFTIGLYFFSSLYYTIPVILSFLIYIFVLDLYMDRKVLNSTWIFTFMILIAGFTALILFTVYSEVRDDKRVATLENSIFVPDKNSEKILLHNKEGLYNEDSIFVERTILAENDLLKILNNGFYNISDTVYFNPKTGDYIKKEDEFDGKYRIKYLYNRKPVAGIKSIIFHGGRILSNNTKYTEIPVRQDFLSDSTKVRKYIVDGMSYLMYRFDRDLIGVHIERIPSILLPFSLFSMLFVLTGIFIFIISFINSRFKILPSIAGISFNGINSLRDRIQFSIIGLVVVSFFVLGLITFYYILNISSQNRERSAVEYTEARVGRSMIDSDKSKDLLDRLLFLEKREGARMYLYDKEGKIVEDNRRKYNINPVIPFAKLPARDIAPVNKGNRVYVDNKILYTVMPALSDSAEPSYVAGYFLSDNSISEASEILSNFLNVYVLLFLVAGAIAIALANSISKPVEILGEKLEVLDLSENNELLKWDKQDEIGKLISIYNSTVKKLEESAKIITKIERDSAWREMAKQVAHEIKNPLTPLKLNIQYMQGVVANTPERASDMVKQLAPGLIEQINNLDKIASEFADFAKMPSASNEKIKLNEIVKTVHDFFRKREDLDIQLYVPINDLVVFADKNHLVSILNNILKNAIQAIPTDKEGKIVIELYKKGTDAIIKITDNGTGIPDEMISKVFSPNFTTKNSGTGLGLAISANMIQAFNGKIYFETEVGTGTSFFVEIPLMRIKDNYPGQARVFLDD